MCKGRRGPVRIASVSNGQPVEGLDSQVRRPVLRPAAVVQTANTGNQLAGGNSSWCPTSEVWTTQTWDTS